MSFLKKLGLVIVFLLILFGLNQVLSLTFYNPAVAIPVYGWLSRYGLTQYYPAVKSLVTLGSPKDLYPTVSIGRIQNSLLLEPRAAVVGTVSYEVKAWDGDWHLNIEDGSGRTLVAEIVPEYSLPLPPLNSPVKIWGIVRYDLEHRWWELHPVLGWEAAKR